MRTYNPSFEVLSRALTSSPFARCHFCHRTNLEKKRQPGFRLHVHHIDGRSRNDTIDNLRVLCGSCHAKLEAMNHRLILRIRALIHRNAIAEKEKLRKVLDQLYD